MMLSPATRGAAPRPALTAEALHECHDCGQFQAIGPLRPGQVAACSRCGAVLRRRRRNSLSTTLALSLTGLFLMAVAATAPLVSIRLAGQERMTTLTNLPVAFQDQDMPVLAIAVVATTLIAPVLRLLLTVGVLVGLRFGLAHRSLVAMTRLRRTLAPWAMVEVFLLGFFVAFSRLEALAIVQTGIGLYALGALMLVMAWSDTWLDEDAVWERIARRRPRSAPLARAPGGHPIGCDACALVSRGHEGGPCPRCATPLRERKPQPIARTWALLLAAAILYIPANLYPVLTVIRLGKGAPSTILGGVEELIEYRMWPLALLVFVASVMVPVGKLIGLGILLVLTQRRSTARLPDRTRLYRLIEAIGRWSMIDVFMVAVLTALVRMGVVATVTPGYGAVAFAGVVVLTMLASQSFDPRIMWDRAGRAVEPRQAANTGAVTA